MLLNLQGLSPEAVQKVFGVKGREVPGGLHFLSNYSRGEKAGSGDINIKFDDGRATNVSGLIDKAGSSGTMEYIWNAYALPPGDQEFDLSTKSFYSASILLRFVWEAPKVQ